MIFTQNCKTTLELVMWIIIQMMVEPLLSTRSVFPNVNMWLMWMSTTQLGDTKQDRRGKSAQKHLSHSFRSCEHKLRITKLNTKWVKMTAVFSFSQNYIQNNDLNVVHKTMWMHAQSILV